jgi:N-acetyl-1-D-myo-inositol-2-amino-2-deoxy-alpha-D-glucopyranoside deacetylase
VVGAILTVVHQSTTLVGATAVPWGLIAALVVAAALLAGLRIVYETRVVAGFAAAGLLVAEGVLSLGTPSGTVLVANNMAGVAWTIGSVLIAALVLAWPRFSTLRTGRIEAPAAKG